MQQAFTIRETTAPDNAHLPALYRAAFPEEDLVPLVEQLLAEAAVLSLAAIIDARPVGHVIFTPGRLGTERARIALLGPLAVHPDHQRQGIGRALVDAGLARLKADGIEQVIVLGDPAYYAGSGFRPKSRIIPPYPLPAAWAEAWQWQRLDGGEVELEGQLVLPGPWMRAELWG